MDAVTAFAFVFLVGLCAAGLAGSLMQIASGRTIGFVEPFVSRGHLARSILAAFAAGPLMLGNDALRARQEKRAGTAALAAVAALAVVWCSATGIVVMEIALRLCARVG